MAYQPIVSWSARCVYAHEALVRTDEESLKRADVPYSIAEGEGAFVTYKCAAKSGKCFRNTEFFTFEDDQIKRIDVYFGATYQDGVFVRQSES